MHWSVACISKDNSYDECFSPHHRSVHQIIVFIFLHMQTCVKLLKEVVVGGEEKGEEDVEEGQFGKGSKYRQTAVKLQKVSVWE